MEISRDLDKDASRKIDFWREEMAIFLSDLSKMLKIIISHNPRPYVWFLRHRDSIVTARFNLFSLAAVELCARAQKTPEPKWVGC